MNVLRVQNFLKIIIDYFLLIFIEEMFTDKYEFIIYIKDELLYAEDIPKIFNNLVVKKVEHGKMKRIKDKKISLLFNYPKYETWSGYNYTLLYSDIKHFKKNKKILQKYYEEIFYKASSKISIPKTVKNKDFYPGRTYEEQIAEDEYWNPECFE